MVDQFSANWQGALPEIRTKWTGRGIGWTVALEGEKVFPDDKHTDTQMRTLLEGSRS